MTLTGNSGAHPPRRMVVPVVIDGAAAGVGTILRDGEMTVELDERGEKWYEGTGQRAVIWFEEGQVRMTARVEEVATLRSTA